MNKLISIYLILLFVLSSCSAEKKCQRRLKRALPCVEFKQDTLIIRDTLKGFKTDTLFIGRNEIDTFYQDTGGIRVKTIVRWKDKVVQQDILKRDTIIEHKIIRQPYVKEVRPKWLTGLLAGLGAFILLLMFLVWAMIKKRG